MIDKKTMGKRSRVAGKRFENKVREDLENKEWIVDKWTNNIGMWNNEGKEVIKKNNIYIIKKTEKEIKFKEIIFDKLIPAKPKYNPFTKRLMMNSAGFPDFIIIRPHEGICFDVMGVESKMSKYLDKEEKEKCKWLLENKIFSKILIAYKGSKRGQILYKNFEANF